MKSDWLTDKIIRFNSRIGNSIDAPIQCPLCHVYYNNIEIIHSNTACANIQNIFALEEQGFIRVSHDTMSFYRDMAMDKIMANNPGGYKSWNAIMKPLLDTKTYLIDRLPEHVVEIVVTHNGMRSEPLLVTPEFLTIHNIVINMVSNISFSETDAFDRALEGARQYKHHIQLYMM